MKHQMLLGKSQELMQAFLPMKLYLMMQVPKQNGTASIIKLQQPRQKAAEERQA